MNEEQQVPAPEEDRIADLDRQIARQEETIRTIEARHSAPSGQRKRFSFAATRKELANESELSATRAERGKLLYDRDFSPTRKSRHTRRRP